MKRKIALALMLGGMMAIGIASQASAQHMSKAMEAKYTAGDQRSGYLYTTPATRALQDDDFNNPSFLWVDQGEKLWNTVDGAAGKSCASCHGDAAKNMKGVSTTYPKYDAEAGKVIAIQQRISICREKNMQAKPWKWESDESLGMTAYVKLQSRGMPMNVSIDGPAREVYEKGKAFYYQRRGLLDMACSNCHVDNAGNMVRADLLSQGQPNGFPTYRLKWQKLGSLHRRFRGCNTQIRAEPYKRGSPEYVALELYLSHRANGLRVETPSVRR